MNLEIERKFLVIEDLLPKLPKGKKIIQGYFNNKPPFTRVSLSSKGKYKICIKSKGYLIRQEFEYEIPMDDAKQIYEIAPYKISKVRYNLDGGWELDYFHHLNLWLAEIEFQFEKTTKLDLPKWIGKEVTKNFKYHNFSLASRGLK